MTNDILKLIEERETYLDTEEKKQRNSPENQRVCLFNFWKSKKAWLDNECDKIDEFENKQHKEGIG